MAITSNNFYDSNGGMMGAGGGGMTGSNGGIKAA